MSAESEPNVAAELETTCSVGKDVAYVYPAWRCPHQLGSLGTVFPRSWIKGVAFGHSGRPAGLREAGRPGLRAKLAHFPRV